MRTQLGRRPRAVLAGVAGLVMAHLVLSTIGAQATAQPGISLDDKTLHIVLADGQDDLLELTRVDGFLGVRYRGAAVLSVRPDACHQLEPGLVGCYPDLVERIRIDTGDGNDVVDGSRAGMPVEISAGNGDDTLYGGDGDDHLKAGAGNDTISPGEGSDFVSGGLGADSVSYLDRSLGVRVTLDGRPDDGGPSEKDNVGKDVETVIGTVGRDVLAGNAGDNVFVGHGGDDVIEGNGGADVIVSDVQISRETSVLP